MTRNSTATPARLPGQNTLPPSLREVSPDVRCIAAQIVDVYLMELPCQYLAETIEALAIEEAAVGDDSYDASVTLPELRSDAQRIARTYES